MFLKTFISDEVKCKLHYSSWREKAKLKKWKRIALDTLIGYIKMKRDIKYKIAQIMYLCLCEEKNHKSIH